MRIYGKPRGRRMRVHFIHNDTASVISVSVNGETELVQIGDTIMWITDNTVETEDFTIKKY